MKWNHCRKGIIEGKVVNEDDVWVWIELINSVNIGHGDPMVGTGFRDVIAQTSETIQIRKSFLTVIESEGRHETI